MTSDSEYIAQLAKELGDSFNLDFMLEPKGLPTPSVPQIRRTTATVMELRTTLSEDGTDTIATLEILCDGVWRTASQGRARRRRGEKRNFELGRALAFSRMFQKIVDQESREVEKYWK